MEDPSALIGKPWNGDLHYKQRPPYEKGVVFVDFDGCLSICNWRNSLLPAYGPNEGYDAFHELLSYDPRNPWVTHMMAEMHKAGVKVVILTGRMENTRKESEAWLKKYAVKWDWMQMRLNGDYQPSEMFKAKYIKTYYKEEVKMIFDDRPKIINHLKGLGYPTFLVKSKV